MTLRQEIEKILSFHSCEFDGRICSDMTLDKYEERPSCEQCRTDRICEAIGKTAEGMPHCKLEENDTLDVNINNATKVQLESDQAYWQGQIKEG